MTVNTALPIDIEGMRANADRLLAPDAEAPAAQELETLTLTLKGHLALILPEVEYAAAARRDDDDMPRFCARMGAAEARRKLSAEPGRRLSDRLAYGRRLSRSLNALCRHYEILRAAAEGRPMSADGGAGDSLSAECILARQPEYKGMHGRCRQTEDVPLPHGGGLLLQRRCCCPCHTQTVSTS